MQDQSIGNVPLVIIAVSLSAVGVVLSLSCSWMTSKKRRVASRTLQRGDGLMMHVSGTGRAISPKAKPPPHRYSTPSPIVSVPINSLAHTLVAPTIIITPPSPLAILADTASLRSDSSIGSAGDLLLENDGENVSDEEENKENNDFCGDSLSEEKVNMEKRKFIKVEHNRHIMDPILRRVNANNTGISTTRHMDQEQKGTVSGAKKSTFREDTNNGSHAAITQGSVNRPHAIMINVMTSGHTSSTKRDIEEGQGHHFSETVPIDEGSDPSECDPVHLSSRPRLKSLEPGAKRADFRFQRATGISKVEVGSS